MWVRLSQISSSWVNGMHHIFIHIQRRIFVTHFSSRILQWPADVLPPSMWLTLCEYIKWIKYGTDPWISKAIINTELTSLILYSVSWIMQIYRSPGSFWCTCSKCVFGIIYHSKCSLLSCQYIRKCVLIDSEVCILELITFLVGCSIPMMITQPILKVKALTPDFFGREIAPLPRRPNTIG